MVAAIKLDGTVNPDFAPLSVTLSSSYGDVTRATFDRCSVVSIVRHAKAPNPLQLVITTAGGVQVAALTTHDLDQRTFALPLDHQAAHVTVTTHGVCP